MWATACLEPVSDVLIPAPCFQVILVPVGNALPLARWIKLLAFSRSPACSPI